MKRLRHQLRQKRHLQVLRIPQTAYFEGCPHDLAEAMENIYRRAHVARAEELCKCLATQIEDQVVIAWQDTATCTWYGSIARPFTHSLCIYPGITQCAQLVKEPCFEWASTSVARKGCGNNSGRPLPHLQRQGDREGWWPFRGPGKRQEKTPFEIQVEPGTEETL